MWDIKHLILVGGLRKALVGEKTQTGIRIEYTCWKTYYSFQCKPNVFTRNLLNKEQNFRSFLSDRRSVLLLCYAELVFAMKKILALRLNLNEDILLWFLLIIPLSQKRKKQRQHHLYEKNKSFVSQRDLFGMTLWEDTIKTQQNATNKAKESKAKQKKTWYSKGF